jgi:UDP-N-acetylglucosamine 2-epimerase (non-hydrolysing)
MPAKVADDDTHASRPRILLVFGTRPEAIKLAPVALALRARGEELATWLCSTGQHRDMLDQALATFRLEPDFDLGLMRPRQTLADLTARALTALATVITRVQPDVVMVQGDTTSAFMGALAAYYHRVPVAHLEAGLRTGDIYQPFPEEGNRRLIGALARLHFAPTSHAARRLRREGVPPQQVFVTGNTVIDALLHVRGSDPDPAVAAPGWGRRLVLLTMHRRESFGRPLENICRAVRMLVDRNSDVQVIFPVHASPFVREPVQRLLGGHDRIRLEEPLGYRTFVRVLDACHLVLTDSGGIQEEAPALGKPVLVLREKTERPEAIRAGTSRLVGTGSRRVLEAAEQLLHDEAAYRAMAHAENPYGDGRASDRVVDALRFHFRLTAERPAPFAPSLPARHAARRVA